MDLNRLGPGLLHAFLVVAEAGQISLAKVTTNTLFAVATPIHIIAPISAGTLKVVPVIKSIQTIPASAQGNAVMMINGSVQDWKFTTIKR
jgi:hypothetical protein